MACIIKIPTEKSKGVVSFTTQERDRFILPSKEVQDKIIKLKEKWLVGLHHNWHDYNFNYNPIFDFSMAGETDLIEKNGQKFSLLPMDACNFVPPYFKNSSGEKFWDILYVARAVKFKKIPEFFECVKSMYKHGKMYKILFICPVPPYKEEDKKNVFYEIREVYDKMFSEEEKSLFTLLTIDYRYPFPFDLQTLAHFYKSSKTFVHFADSERRCRVAAYAWAAGLPVVGMSCIGSLLPKELQKTPYFYEVKNYKEFESKIDQAIKESEQNKSEDEVAKYFEEKNAIEMLENYLKDIFGSKGETYEKDLIFSKSLDIRLGRHHLGENKLNTLNMTFEAFLDALISRKEFTDLLEIEDPEKYLENKNKGFIAKIKSIF